MFEERSDFRRGVLSHISDAGSYHPLDTLTLLSIVPGFSLLSLVAYWIAMCIQGVAKSSLLETSPVK